MNDKAELSRATLAATVLVAALGYFVDVYDLQLFSVVRVTSLTDLGVPRAQQIDQGVFLINAQMIGMLLGGVFWGILGDKKGRVSVLFGSIALYSLGNIANAFVHTVNGYAWWRFVAGFGLAGELGAAITLVSELLPSRSRGYGTTIVGAVGLTGAVIAGVIGQQFTWRTAYLIGGLLGLCLLAARVKMSESGLFHAAKENEVQRGDFMMILGSAPRLLKYLACIAIGVPIWYALGVLMTFAPEISASLGATGPVLAPKAVMYTYIGVVIGNLTSGLASQWLKSRRKAILASLVLTTAMVLVFLNARGLSASQTYGVLCVLGVAIGYWAVFATVAAEQFGTNLRATVTTSVPNFVRGCVVPLTLSFKALREPPTGDVKAALIVGAVTMTLAFLGLWRLDESYDRELDYNEK